MAKKRAKSKKSAARQPIQRKKSTKKAKPGKSVSLANDKTKNELKRYLNDILENISVIKSKSTRLKKELTTLQKEMNKKNKIQDKMELFAKIESLRNDCYVEMEPQIRVIANLLNSIYPICLDHGGKIKATYLQLYQDLTKGFNLTLLEKDVLKIKRSIR